MLKIDLKDFLSFIFERWYRKSTLLIIILFSIFSLLWLFSVIKIDQISITQIVLITIVVTLFVFIWLYTTRIPKARKGSVGFAIAITSETEEQRERIASDFIQSLKDQLSGSNLRYKFSFVELPKYYSDKIITLDDARYYLHTIKCHFMVYGRTKIRNIDGRNHHILNLEGVVAHSPIPIEISHQFSNEFTELFPRKLILSSENDLFAFEFTTEWLHHVTKYVIGIASLLSGDIEYAQSLFENLQHQLSAEKATHSVLNKMRQRIPIRLTDVYLSQARIQYEQWKKTREQGHLDSIKYFLERLNIIAPNNYGAHLLRAIWFFLSKRDIASAKAELRKCRDERDATWKYSSAFLFAYEGDMKKANTMYKTAFRGSYEQRVILEVEEFISWVLEQEPDKIQLFFCLGLINLFAKEDKIAALRDFELFLKHAQESMFGDTIRLAKEYIQNIRSH